MVSIAREWVTVQPRPANTFDRLFLQEYDRVVAIAYRVLGDAAEAEDVAQDVFCDFYHRHPPEATYASSWLYRAAAHSALNVIRGKKRRQRRETAEAEDSYRVAGVAESALDPQMALEEAERRREVRAALARLNPKQASVLVLRYSGLSYAEVAEALGVRIGQVGTLLRRAEAALKKEMSHASPR